MAASKYKFTDGDADAIAAMGYSFDGIPLRDFRAFMLKNYPGFNLAHLLKQVEQLMAPHAGSFLTRRITVHGRNMQVELFNDHGGDEDKALIFDRVFYKEKSTITVSHEYLVLPVSARDQGLSKKVLKASLEQYLKMGVGEIKVIAGLSAGAYVWARHGFLAIKRAEMTAILKKAKGMLTADQYDVVQLIYDHYYTAKPRGKAFPIRQWAALPFMKPVLTDGKTQWEGRLDLKNKQQLRKFEQYVSK